MGRTQEVGHFAKYRARLGHDGDEFPVFLYLDAAPQQEEQLAGTAALFEQDRAWPMFDAG